MVWLYIAIGGAIGAAGRHAAGIIATHCFGHGLPYGTLIVNILGGLLMGLLVGLLARFDQGAEWLRPLLAVGVLGGFTTFSTFALDIVTLSQRGAIWWTGGYILLSVVGSVMALLVGLSLARYLATGIS